MKHVNKCEWQCLQYRSMTCSRNDERWNDVMVSNLSSINSSKLQRIDFHRSTDHLSKLRECSWRMKNFNVAQIELTLSGIGVPQPQTIRWFGSLSVDCGSRTGRTVFENWNGGLTLKSAISCSGNSLSMSVPLYMCILVSLCKVPPFFHRLDPART